VDERAENECSGGNKELRQPLVYGVQGMPCQRNVKTAPFFVVYNKVSYVNRRLSGSNDTSVVFEVTKKIVGLRWPRPSEQDNAVYPVKALVTSVLL